MPSVGYVFKRITAVVSEDGDFGLAITNTEDRLYRVFSNVAKEHGINSPQGTVIQFPLTHEDLSFLTGAHRVSISYGQNN
jgi:CRP/FNR family transcriptional regulator